MSANAVESQGDAELDGHTVRVLQARQPKRIITAWIRPETGLPVQLAIELPEQQRRVLWASIKIDEELDDSLFSVEPPAGYTLFKGGLYTPGPEDKMKLMAKMMRLLRACHTYREKNNGRFPQELGELTNLKAVGISAEALKTILAAPDQPDGPPVIVYRQPREGREWGKEIMLYQAFDQWPTDGLIAAGFADGHCEVIRRQQFEELMQ